jgi:hypothetical protein
LSGPKTNDPLVPRAGREEGLNQENSVMALTDP